MNLTPLQIIGIILAVNGALTGATAQLTDLFGPLIAKDIVSVASLGSAILGGIITAISGQATMIKNVAAMPGVETITVNKMANPALATIAVDPAQLKVEATPQAAAAVNATARAALNILIAAVLLSAFLFAPPALAQQRGPIGQKIHDDLAGKSAAISDTIAGALAKPFQDLANFIGSDADGGVTLATAIPNIQDGHGQQCWIEMQSFGAIIKAHPIPITFHVIQDYETLRLLGIATNRLCTNVHCTQVFADFTAMAQAASPVPLAIPSLHDLCTKVPQIAVVPPVSVPPQPSDTPAPK